MGTYYPIADRPTVTELRTLGTGNCLNIRAKPTGETRSPHKGEWYLSGAIIEAYRAPNDLDQQFRIARLVRIKHTIEEA